MKALLLILLLISSVVGQRPSVLSAQQNEERIAKLILTREPDDPFRHVLEKGNRGDGIHHAWMDLMKRHAIQQASFTMRFVWKDGVQSLKITSLNFFQRYYSDTSIKSRKVLHEIQADGSETALRNAALDKAREYLPHLMENVARTANVRPRRAHGTLYLNLLDDEALPILDMMPNVEW